MYPVKIQNLTKKFLFIAGVFIILLNLNLVSPKMKEINYNYTGSADSIAHFYVRTLKYEPYPVNPGDWFDLWVKVQNVGKKDAKDARFKLLLEYPFLASSPQVMEYGVVPGEQTAWKYKQLNEELEANQVVMKFRVKVADNAPEGRNIIKLQINTDNFSNGIIYDLPIEIAKSKVDFDIAFQNYNGVKSSFSITNIGEKYASNIILKANYSEWDLIDGDRAINIGGLDQGEFTRFSIQGTPKNSKVSFNVSYTDISGVRRSLVKEVYIGEIQKPSLSNSGLNYLDGIFFLIGILTGILIMIFSRKIHNRKRRG